MNDKCFVDTSVLVYAHDRTAGTKHHRALQLVEELWNSGKGVVSTQVPQELCVNLRKKVDPPCPGDELRRLILDHMSWEVMANTAESIVEALDLEVRYRTWFWDALILHSALHCGATILYTEDLAPGEKYGAIQVVSPLIAH